VFSIVSVSNAFVPPSTTGCRKPIYSQNLAKTESRCRRRNRDSAQRPTLWLYAAVDPETNDFLHVRLFPTRTIVLTKQFLAELQEKHDVADAVFLVDGAPWLQAALFEENLRFQHVTHGNRNAVERVFKEVKRRTEQFANHFRHATAESAETWLQTFAFAWNQLI